MKKGRRRRADRLLRLAQAPNAPRIPCDEDEVTTPAAFMRVVHGLMGGRVRTATLSRRRRSEIATNAAQQRQQAKPELVTVFDGFWPTPAIPPVQQLEERAREICRRLLHGGTRHDFEEYLQHRPDWRAHVEFVMLQLMETCSL